MAEVRRLLLALAAPVKQCSFLFTWSQWRRTHQAVAARCHRARRARGRDQPIASMTAPSTLAPVTERRTEELTIAEWEAVRALLPPQRPSVGRPRHDHHTILGGIVWVLRNQASWRALPPTFGNWQTVYKRYRLWQATGLWQQLATALSLDATTSTAEVSL